MPPVPSGYGAVSPARVRSRCCCRTRRGCARKAPRHCGGALTHGPLKEKRSCLQEQPKKAGRGRGWEGRGSVYQCVCMLRSVKVPPKMGHRGAHNDFQGNSSTFTLCPDSGSSSKMRCLVVLFLRARQARRGSYGALGIGSWADCHTPTEVWFPEDAGSPRARPAFALDS